MTSGINPHINPTDRWCWNFCNSCNRCQDKGRYGQCGGCSGRYDPKLVIPSDDEDVCDCANGVLRWRTKQGRTIVTRFKSNPFKGEVKYIKQSEDERDWDAYVNDMREKMGDPDWNPIHFYDED